MPDRLQEIRARLDAATPGPNPSIPLRDRQDAMDALYAHAPADIAWLLGEVERAKASEVVAWETSEWSQEIDDSLSCRDANNA